jgi:hypothetical protein
MSRQGRLHLPPSPRALAESSPRSEKVPGSKEWCWQVLTVLKLSYGRLAEEWQTVERYREELAQHHAWDVVPPGHPYGSEDAMLRAEIGVDTATLEHEVRDLRAKNEADQAQERPRGVHADVDNVNIIDRPTGNTQRQALRRLRQAKSPLLEDVLVGTLSPHRAMILAGFRAETWTVPADVQGIARALRRRLSPGELQQLRAALAVSDAEPPHPPPA